MALRTKRNVLRLRTVNPCFAFLSVVCYLLVTNCVHTHTSVVTSHVHPRQVFRSGIFPPTRDYFDGPWMLQSARSTALFHTRCVSASRSAGALFDVCYTMRTRNVACCTDLINCAVVSCMCLLT